MPLQCLLGILLLSCWANCFQECEVKDRLEYKPDIPVTFKALARPNTTFEAEVSCKKGILLRHLLTFESTSIRLDRNTYKEINSLSLPSPGFDGGWTQFTLAMGLDGYDFMDSKGRSWIPKNVSRECPAKKVILSNGQLVDSCADGAPTWQVSGEKCVEIPFLKTDLGWFTLHSATPFNPKFTAGGMEFALGWKDGDLKILSDATLPLPPHRRYCFSFSRLSDGNVKLKALQEDHSQLIVFLASAVLKVSACDRLLGSFKLQLSNEKCVSIPDGGNSLLVTGIVVGVVGAVSIKFICCWCFLKRRRNNREKETRIRKPNGRPPAVPYQSLPQSPRALPEIVPQPGPSSLSQPNGQSLQEDIYCEMKTMTNVAPPGSFNLVLTQVHEDPVEDETINEVYVSADLVHS